MRGFGKWDAVRKKNEEREVWEKRRQPAWDVVLMKLAGDLVRLGRMVNALMRGGVSYELLVLQKS